MNKLHRSRRRISLQTFIPSVTLRLLFLVLVCYKTWLKSLAIHMWLISNLPFFYCPPPQQDAIVVCFTPLFRQPSRIFISCLISGVINRFERDLIFMRLTELCSHNVSRNNNLLSTSKPTHWHPDHVRGISLLVKKTQVLWSHTHMNFVSYSDEMHGLISFPRLSEANLSCCLPQWDLQWDL